MLMAPPPPPPPRRTFLPPPGRSTRPTVGPPLPPAAAPPAAGPAAPPPEDPPPHQPADKGCATMPDKANVRTAAALRRIFFISSSPKRFHVSQSQNMCGNLVAPYKVFARISNKTAYKFSVHCAITVPNEYRRRFVHKTSKSPINHFSVTTYTYWKRSFQSLRNRLAGNKTAKQETLLPKSTVTSRDKCRVILGRVDLNTVVFGRKHPDGVPMFQRSQLFQALVAFQRSRL